MKPRGIIAIISLAVLMAVFFYRLTPREPEYQGRSLSSWLRTLDDGYRYSGLPWQTWTGIGGRTPQPARAEAEEAIRQMGTNALPYLLRAVTNRDSALKTEVLNLLRKQVRFKVHIPGAEDYRRPAEMAFHALGPAASNAVPELSQALNANQEMDIGGTAASALAGIGPQGWAVLTETLSSSSNSWNFVAVCAEWALGSHRATVPGTVTALMGQVTHTTPGGSAALAEWALGEIGQDGGEVVPLLLKNLESPTAANDVRWSAAQALGKFGTNAQSAVPALVTALQDQDMSVRNQARDSLKLIDLKALAEAEKK